MRLTITGLAAFLLGAMTGPCQQQQQPANLTVLVVGDETASDMSIGVLSEE